jgi:hypothetical protein
VNWDQDPFLPSAKHDLTGKNAMRDRIEQQADKLSIKFNALTFDAIEGKYDEAKLNEFFEKDLMEQPEQVRKVFLKRCEESLDLAASIAASTPDKELEQLKGIFKRTSCGAAIAAMHTKRLLEDEAGQQLDFVAKKCSELPDASRGDADIMVGIYRQASKLPKEPSISQETRARMKQEKIDEASRAAVILSRPLRVNRPLKLKVKS